MVWQPSPEGSFLPRFVRWYDSLPEGSFGYFFNWGGCSRGSTGSFKWTSFPEA